MLDRNGVKNIILDIEENYDVCNWKHNGYFVWPVLRISLYLSLLTQNENISSSQSKKKFSKLGRILNFIKNWQQFFLLKKKINVLYIGAPSHCVNYNGVQYNRYFDPLMDANESSSLYLSKSDSKKGVYKPERHFLIPPIHIVFSIIDKIFGSYSPSTPYIKELCEIIQSKGIHIDGLERALKAKVHKVDVSFAMFQFLFKKVKPEQVWVLCYYSADILGLLIAAHKLSIKTIDMQHGGQGDNHLAYSNWTHVPESGYEALPNHFYTWDDSSAKSINAWAIKNQKHTARVFGNPWVDGWKLKKFQQSSYVWPENIVLYTLQPIGEPLEDYLLKTIQNTKDKWDWWLRLHPRQTDEKEKIILRLKKYNLFEAVNIEEATSLPLPEILTHTEVHITKFSGCALEAYEFDIPSLIIDSRGVDIYKDYIDANDKIKAVLTNSSQDLIQAIENVST